MTGRVHRLDLPLIYFLLGWNRILAFVFIETITPDLFLTIQFVTAQVKLGRLLESSSQAELIEVSVGALSKFYSNIISFLGDR